MFAIRGKARSRGPRDGSRTDWENRLRDRIDGRSERHVTAAPRGREQPTPPTRPVDRRLLPRDRDLSRPRARPGDGQRLLLRRLRAHQRVHGRDSDPESRARPRRRRGALWRVRSRVQRAAGEGGAETSMARRLDPLLADAARPRRPHRNFHPARAAAHASVRRSWRRLRARRRSLARSLPDRRAARALRDRRRDPEHVPPLRRAGARAGRVEPRHRRRPRPRRSANPRRERAALSLRGRRRPRDAGPAPPADPMAAASGRSAHGGHRLARSCGQARTRADAARDADDRAHQRQLPRRHALCVASARPGARAGGDRQGVPPLHAPAGRLRRRRHDGPLPDARAVCRS